MKENNALELLERELKILNSSPTGRRAFLTAMPLLLASCATTSSNRHREGDNTGQYTSIGPKEERKMAEEYLPKMKKEYPTFKNSYAQSYIRDLGQRVVKSNNLDGRPYNYSFEVVESKHVNAFALPAGPVFITKPLIAMASTEAELAGVIGHEIGHIKARHTAERIEAAKKEQKKSLFYGIGGALLGGAAGFGLGKLLCKKQDRECLRRAAMYGAAAGGAGGLLIQKFGFMANSREDEMEADRIGFKTSIAAGFHPQYVGNFYEKLLKMEQQYKSKQDPISRAFVDAMSTHPPSKERVNQMLEMERNHSGRNGTVSSNSFKKVKKIIG